MPVDVLYEGLVLAERAEPKRMPSGWFVPMAAPMPVGTRLAVVVDGVKRAAQVARVQESAAEPGVFVVGEDGVAAALDQLPPFGVAAAPRMTAAAGPAETSGAGVLEFEAEAPDDEPTLEISTGTDAAAHSSSEGDKNGEADGKKGRKRRRKGR